MPKAATQPLFSRAPLLGIAGLLAASLLVAVVGRMQGPVALPVSGTAVASQELRFEDGPDGSVLVRRATDNSVLETMTGENGFIRGTMRGLARNRRAEGIGAAPPFRLTAWTDGRLTLDDTATGRRIELEAFGSENRAVFDRLLLLALGRAS